MYKKLICAVLLTALILFSISSCKKEEEVKDAITFQDDLGRTVTVEKADRTACLLGSFAQVWLLAGGNVCATADDAWDDLKLDLSPDTVNLGRINNLSLEGLISSNPDFIIATPNAHQNVSWEDTMNSANIPIAYFEIYSFKDYLRMLDICTDITGRKDLYEKYGTNVDKEIQAILSQNRTDEVKVLSLVASASYLKAKNSKSSVLGRMLKDLGCINLADSEKSLLENLSIEYILQSDPDYIFITQRGDDKDGMIKYIENYFKEHPAWLNLKAVKEGRVYLMDKMLYNLKPNHRWAEAYKGLQEILLDKEL